MILELFFVEIAQESDFPARIGARDIGQLSRVRPNIHTPVQHRPVPSSTLSSVVAGSPSERYALATAAGPQRDPFDCQVRCRLNVAATGKRHARSTRSDVRVTDDAIASGGTLDWPTTRALAPKRMAAMTRVTTMLMERLRCIRMHLATVVCARSFGRFTVPRPSVPVAIEIVFAYRALRNIGRRVGCLTAL